MTAIAAPARPAPVRPEATRLVGLHGLKRRRLESTVRDGLCRPSAAWFEIGSRRAPADLRATLSACVYHALGLSVVAELAEQTRPGGYAAWFRAHSGELPAVLAFPDRPTGDEIWRRYLWVGSTAPGRTAVYTKVARAGRTAGPWWRPRVFVVRHGTIARLEGELDRVPLAHRDTRLALAEDDAPTTVVDTKLARFCGALADSIGAALFPRPAP